jgi:hypothetical protein
MEKEKPGTKSLKSLHKQIALERFNLMLPIPCLYNRSLLPKAASPLPGDISFRKQLSEDCKSSH